MGLEKERDKITKREIIYRRRKIRGEQQSYKIANYWKNTKIKTEIRSVDNEISSRPLGVIRGNTTMIYWFA